MKKFFALILALVMMASLSVTAFAGEVDSPLGLEPEDSYTVIVSGIYNRVNNQAPVYGVDITWANLEFTYTEIFNWSADDKAYTERDKGYWEETSGTITVTNRSNAAIVATLRDFSADNHNFEFIIDDVEVGVVNVELASVTDSTPGAITTKTVTVSLAEETEAISDNMTIGTIAVVISTPEE